MCTDKICPINAKHQRSVALSPSLSLSLLHLYIICYVGQLVLTQCTFVSPLNGYPFLMSLILLER
jgi:hypothetical protein